jgi:hypothetical protein
MDLIIKTKYAILLQPIYQDILLHLKNDGLEGLEFLTDWLIGKEIDSVATEQSLEGTFKGINIKGIADLIASKMGANYLIDLKWSGRNRFMKELQMNREIQLGAYCQMLPQTEINPAYYIIRDKEFLTPTAAAFNAMDYQFEASPEATFLASMDVVNSISSTIKTGTIHCRGIDETINEELTVMENTDKTRRIAATSPIQAKFKNGCFFCDYGVICGKGRNQS